MAAWLVGIARIDIPLSLSGFSAICFKIRAGAMKKKIVLVFIPRVLSVIAVGGLLWKKGKSERAFLCGN